MSKPSRKAPKKTRPLWTTNFMWLTGLLLSWRTVELGHAYEAVAIAIVTLGAVNKWSGQDLRDAWPRLPGERTLPEKSRKDDTKDEE